jgi:hypothetical protein
MNRHDRISQILSTLREGSDSIRGNPSEYNYRSWEKKLERSASRSQPVGAIVGIAVVVIFGIFALSLLVSKNDRDCIIHNDNGRYFEVNIREGCDYRECGYEDSSVIGSCPNGTHVALENQPSVRSGGFTWVRVRVIDSGQEGWIASSKIYCQ